MKILLKHKIWIRRGENLALLLKKINAQATRQSVNLRKAFINKDSKLAHEYKSVPGAR